MKHVKNILYNDASIIYTDLSNLDQESARAAMESAVRVITSMPLKSAYSLINFDGLILTRSLISEIKSVGTTNNPFVKATAICGLNPMATFLANSIIKLTKRNAKLFKDPEEGKTWLYQESLKSNTEEELLVQKFA